VPSGARLSFWLEHCYARFMHLLHKFLRLVGIASLFSAAATAEETVVLSPRVSFGTFPLAVHRTAMVAHPGLPAGKAELDSPFPDDFPPHIVVTLEERREFPALKKGARYFSPARNEITVYRISDVEKAPYKTIQPDIAALKKILAERPKRAPDHAADSRGLPDYPPRNAAHVFELRLGYLEADWGRGIYYLTQFTQEDGHFANNEELVCVFQGLSKDGAFYVSADLRMTLPGLPAGIDAKAPLRDGKDPGIPLITKARDEAFTPSLAKVREWLSSVQLK
jgi:hypothetical protein